MAKLRHHYDEDKRDVRWDELIELSRRTKYKPLTASVSSAKLTNQLALEIKAWVKREPTVAVTTIAQHYRINPESVSDVLSGRHDWRA